MHAPPFTSRSHRHDAKPNADARNSPLAQDEIIKNATSFSCSIGPKVNDIVGPVLERNKEKVPYEMRPQLFACENDHNAVEALDARLKGRVEVVPCMVDRICSDREIVKGQIKVRSTPAL